MDLSQVDLSLTCLWPCWLSIHVTLFLCGMKSIQWMHEIPPHLPVLCTIQFNSPNLSYYNVTAHCGWNLQVVFYRASKALELHMLCPDYCGILRVDARTTFIKHRRELGGFCHRGPSRPIVELVRTIGKQHVKSLPPNRFVDVLNE